MATTRIVVVGGGVIGCAIARTLADDYDVTVVERDEVAAGATGRAAGEVTMSPSYADVPAIADHANAFFRDYDGTDAFEFHEAESLELVSPEREDEAHRRVERLASAGIDVSFLEPSAVEQRYPRFDVAGYAGAICHPETGFLDPYTLATTLARDAERRGATVLAGTPVTAIAANGGVIHGVETPDGRIDAATVVVATGWRSPELLADHLALPVRPYRTQCVVLEPDNPLERDFPMGWVPQGHVYFRPELNGDLLVGGWSFAEDDPEGASGAADEPFREHVAEIIPEFLRGFDHARYVDGWAGVDGATPDTRPIIDAPTEAPDGLVVATGFHGRGVMSAPVAATAVRSIVTGGDAPFPLDLFELDRFESRSRDFEFHSISA